MYLFIHSPNSDCANAFLLKFQLEIKQFDLRIRQRCRNARKTLENYEQPHGSIESKVPKKKAQQARKPLKRRQTNCGLEICEKVRTRTIT